MSFFVDIVTEDSFYENLTLGVVRILENSPCVKNVKVDRRNACERSVLSSWEQRHCCQLPEDLKNFYASIDGFQLTWTLDIAGEEFPVGKMSIGEFASLKRYVSTRKSENRGDEETVGRASSTTRQHRQQHHSSRRPEGPEGPELPSLDSRCKLFELDRCADARVLLAYQVRPESDNEPTIWLRQGNTDDPEEPANWYRLAENFTKYFRMMLVHLGLPQWQYCALGLSLPTWIEQVYYLIGPHLLSNVGKPTETVSGCIWKEGPLNTIDLAIFKGRESNKQRNSRKK